MVRVGVGLVRGSRQGKFGLGLRLGLRWGYC